MTPSGIASVGSNPQELHPNARPVVFGPFPLTRPVRRRRSRKRAVPPPRRVSGFGFWSPRRSDGRVGGADHRRVRSRITISPGDLFYRTCARRRGGDYRTLSPCRPESRRLPLHRTGAISTPGPKRPKRRVSGHVSGHRTTPPPPMADFFTGRDRTHGTWPRGPGQHG